MEKLTETELLAILLGTGGVGEHQNAMDHARALLVKFGLVQVDVLQGFLDGLVPGFLE